MKLTVLVIAATCLLSACRRSGEFADKEASLVNAGFIQYTIPKGAHECTQNPYRPGTYRSLEFEVYFDSSAVYTTLRGENQFDINKLFGFSDDGAHHHRSSARFGWRWSEGHLRLFAYVYADGALHTKELGVAGIHRIYRCSIGIENGAYVFGLDGATWTLPRSAKSERAEGYRLYPYFGGDETAPEDVHIWIKQLPERGI